MRPSGCSSPLMRAALPEERLSANGKGFKPWRDAQNDRQQGRSRRKHRRRNTSHPPTHKLPRQLVLHMGYVEDAFEVRTKHGKRCVSARPGWAGEKSGFFSILQKNGPPLCGTPRLPSNRSGIQQSFSRSRLIAPRLHLHPGSHLRPCLVAPTIDSASLESPPRHRNRSGALCTLAAQGRVKLKLGCRPTNMASATSFDSHVITLSSESTSR